MNIIIIEDNIMMVNEIIEYFEGKLVNIVGVAYNGEKGIELLEKEKENVNFVILDSIMPIKNGIDVLKYMKLNGINVKVIYTLCRKDKNREYLEYDHKLLVKPYNVKELELLINDKPNYKNVIHNDYELKVIEKLFELGFSPNYEGYKYIKDILLDLDYEYTKNLKKLYIKTGEKYNKDMKNIESSIRYTINICLSRGNLNKINDLFSYMLEDDKLRPTNKEFIYILYEIIK